MRKILKFIKKNFQVLSLKLKNKNNEKVLIIHKE